MLGVKIVFQNKYLALTNKIIQRKDGQPYINYSEQELLNITKETIPIIKMAFNELIDIVIEAWRKKSVSGSYYSY